MVQLRRRKLNLLHATLFDRDDTYQSYPQKLKGSFNALFAAAQNDNLTADNSEMFVVENLKTVIPILEYFCGYQRERWAQLAFLGGMLLNDFR